MAQRILTGQVVNGQLRVADDLTAFEGQSFTVTLQANGVSPPFGSQRPASLPVSEAESNGVAGGEEEIEPPEWLDVEKDVGKAIPFRKTGVKIKIVRRGRMKPCIIVPETDPEDSTDE